MAPIAGILVLGLIVADTPLRLRWAASRPAFETVAKQVTEDPRFEFRGDRRIGMYAVTEVHRQGEAVIFYEKTGAFTDDAGFAYLPNGPFAALESGSFERPRFRSLGGGWYAFTASW